MGSATPRKALLQALAAVGTLVVVSTAAQAQPIGEIQGAGHRSPSEGEFVTVEGVVTLALPNGFYIQGEPDGDVATSDGLYLFASDAGLVSVGDRVLAEGRVIEFVPPSRPTALPLSEIASPDVVVVESGVPLPTPIMIGEGGRIPPTESIDDGPAASFDPANDGLDFYESLEGMRVMVPQATALSPVNRFGAVWVVADSGTAATSFDGSGALVMTERDANPERILINLDLVEVPEGLEAGTRLGNITGVLSYRFGNFTVLATDLGQDAPPPSNDVALTIGVYNVQNLDPKREDPALVGNPDRDIDNDVGEGRFEAIGEHIVDVLGAPAIVALQEVQDNDGTEQTPIVAADATLRLLARAITAAGGPAYDFVDVPPEDDQDGGQLGGNIRVAFLFDPERALPVAGGIRRLRDDDPDDGDAFQDTPKPLLTAFETGIGEIILVNVDLSSRAGSDPAFGSIQPPTVGNADNRLAQTQLMIGDINALLEANPEAQVLVLGSFNAFYFEPELVSLEAEAGLSNLWRTLPQIERRSVVVEGQAQAVDHVLVSSALEGRTELKVFNVNAGRVQQASDHDPLVVGILAAGADAAPPSLDVLGLPLAPLDLEADELRAWLRAHWHEGRHRFLGYNLARRAMFSSIDVAEDGRVYGVYSGFSQPARDTTFLDPIDTEHTVPQSWFDQDEPMRSDLHALFPTHRHANQARDADPFGEIDDAQTEVWFGADGSRLIELTEAPADRRDTFAEDRRGEFEPPEGHEGDLARAVFYFYTMYPDVAGTIDDIAADGVAQLHQWHLDDPPDAKERARNDRVEGIQGNRNPYVDRPGWACRAFEVPCP